MSVQKQHTHQSSHTCITDAADCWKTLEYSFKPKATFLLVDKPWCHRVEGSYLTLVKHTQTSITARGLKVLKDCVDLNSLTALWLWKSFKWVVICLTRSVLTAPSIVYHTAKLVRNVIIIHHMVFRTMGCIKNKWLSHDENLYTSNAV